MPQHESMEFDVIIVGAGPSGLSAAIRLGQLAHQQNKTLDICIVEKGAEVGAHILSGAVIEPSALNELIPDWQAKQAPLHTPVKQDHFLMLTQKRAFHLPVPPIMSNHGNYIISLGELCRWLALQAESLGVQIFPGFAATRLLIENNRVNGIMTGDKGLDKQGQPTPSYQPAMALYAKQVLIAEGCRGSLTRTLCEYFDLRKHADPQTYALGIKELWETPDELIELGTVSHSIGWPLNHKTYGGSFIYQVEKNLLAIGLVIGLDYQNPYLNPYEEFQRFKTHPYIYPVLKQSKRIAYGARSLNEGGLQSIPQLTFPGGLLMGCAAGFLNVPKIKGIHTAMKSGMIAAESLFPLLHHSKTLDECVEYSHNIKQSTIWKELYKARNIRPAMRWGLWPGLAYSALDTFLLRGHAPWTLHHDADYKQLKKADEYTKLEYPKHDNQVTFDLMNSVSLTHVHYKENQPCHLKLQDPSLAISVNFKLYASPETRYCPAGVYEIVHDENNTPRLQINFTNCIQCKACDIKDRMQNIRWTPPEGSDGPNYSLM